MDDEYDFRPTMPVNRRQTLLNTAGSQKQKTFIPSPSAKRIDSSISDREGGERRTSGLVPGWAVVLISLAVAFNVAVLVWLVSRRQRQSRYPDHIKVPTEER